MIPQSWKWELTNTEILPQSHPWMRDAAPGKGGQICQVLPRDVFQESSLNWLKPYSLWIMYQERKGWSRIWRRPCWVLFSYLGWSSPLTEWGSTSPLMPNKDFGGDATSEGRTRPTLADEHTSWRLTDLNHKHSRKPLLADGGGSSRNTSSRTKSNHISHLEWL